MLRVSAVAAAFGAAARPRITTLSTTVTNNFAGGGGTPGPVGGVCRSAGTVTIRNSIVAANQNNGTVADVGGSFASSGYNLIGNADAATGFTQPSDQTGTGAAPLNPLFHPLPAYNLGPDSNPPPATDLARDR